MVIAMVEHLTMNTVIHAAVRRDLARFADALERFPVGNQRRAEQLNRAWRFLDHQLEHHHHSEEEIFWPAMQQLGADEALVGDLNGEHERMAQAMILTRAAMAELAVHPSEANVQRAKAAFSTLDDSIRTHFAHEERDLEPVMARLADTPELKEASTAVRKTQSLPSAGAYLAWLLDGAGPDERAYLTHLLPRPVLAILPRVFGRSYTLVAATWA
jgi:hemerythrin-like domain-containing protein